jgi:hypothetical protein
MKKILLIFCITLFSTQIFAQQFALYNTGTLYDTFENPSQRAFNPDTSRKFAFNFFLPNFNSGFSIAGNGQAALKSRAFLGRYNDTALMIGKGRFNHVNVNANVYLFMFKIFTSLSGDQEIGFSEQIRFEGKGLFSDESIALFNGTQKFADGPYSEIFNNKAYFHAYHQLAFTYREKINKKVAVGVKISALLGIDYQEINTVHSSAVIDGVKQTAQVSMQGTSNSSYIPGSLVARDFLPTLRNPGAAISIGSTYRTEDGFLIQGNIKDFGYIHWNARSKTYAFNNSGTISGLNLKTREDSVFQKANSLTHKNSTVGAFTKPINGTAEFSVNKILFLDQDHQFKYSPTLIASKELFYTGFTAALVNPVKYGNSVITLTTTYNDLKVFTLGAQFLKQKDNMEFYIGSDKIVQSSKLLYQAINNNSSMVNKNYQFTGADLYIGFALKFGPLIEHPMNASYIPMGEKGFLSRLFNRLFKAK